MNHAAQKLPPRPAKSLWWLLPVGLLGAMVFGLSVLLVIAQSDPAFAIEKDYYAKAVAWDAHRAQVEQNARLGWSVQSRVSGAPGAVEVTLSVQDRQGQPVTGANVSLIGFHNARAADRLERRLKETAAGTYQGELGRVRPGLWELRLVVDRDGVRFTDVQRLDVSAGSAR